MTRLEAHAINIRREWVDVGDAVRGAVQRALRSFPDRACVAVVEDNLPLVTGDAVLLEQCIFNILDNAHKYSGPASTTRVDARRASGSIVIAVTDAGMGIPADDLQRVFEKFYRVAGSDGRSPGTGLGLSICAGFIKAMGGEIAAESPAEGGVGTRIAIALPVAESATP